MQGLEGGRGPPADFGRNRTRREETSNGTFDRRAGDIYNERGHTYDRMHGSGFVDTDTWNGPFTAPGARPPPPYDDDSRRRGDIYPTHRMLQQSYQQPQPRFDAFPRYREDLHPLAPEFMHRQMDADPRYWSHPATMRAPPPYGYGHGRVQRSRA